MINSDEKLLDFVKKEGVKDDEKVALLTGTAVSVLSKLVSEGKEKRQNLEEILVGLFVWLQEDFTGIAADNEDRAADNEERGLRIRSFVEVLNGIRNVLQCRSLMVTSSIEGAKRDRLAVEELLGLNAYDDNNSFCEEMWSEKKSASKLPNERLQFLTQQKSGVFNVPLFFDTTEDYLKKYVLCCKKKSNSMTVNLNNVHKVPSYYKFGQFYGLIPPRMYFDGFRKSVSDLIEDKEGNVDAILQKMKEDAKEELAQKKKKNKNPLAKHVVKCLGSGRDPERFIKDGMRTLYQVLNGCSSSAICLLQRNTSTEKGNGLEQFVGSGKSQITRMFNKDGYYKHSYGGKKNLPELLVECLLRSVWESVRSPDDAILMKSIFDLNGAGARTVWTPEVGNSKGKKKTQSTTIFGTLTNDWRLFPPDYDHSVSQCG